MNHFGRVEYVRVGRLINLLQKYVRCDLINIFLRTLSLKIVVIAIYLIGKDEIRNYQTYGSDGGIFSKFISA